MSDIFARAAASPPAHPDDDGPFDPNNPWDCAAQLIEALFVKNDALEKRCAALEAQRLARNGQDGIGIEDLRIDAKTGHLIVHLTDGAIRDVGRVTAEPAAPPHELKFERDVSGKIVRAILK
jgi:hypothetical protein